MSILQWNIQSLKSNFSELKTLLHDLNPTCVCLQETMLGDKVCSPPSSYDIIQSPKKRNDGHERSVAILINKNCSFKPLPLNTPLQAVAVQLWLGRWYTVCSLYLPHIVVTQNELENLIDQLPEPFLLLGDMNARHHLWGEPIDNDRGKIFENLLLSSNLSLLNSNAPTHYHIQTGTHSTIDLSLTSNDCYLDFTSKVLQNLYGSDHYPIVLEMINPVNHPEPLSRYKVQKADWISFKQLTSNYSIPISTEIDEIVTDLNAYILNAADETIPKSSGRRKNPPLPWWNRECKQASTERNRAERACKRNPSVPNKIAYRRCKAVCRYLFNKCRKESWEKYVSSLNVGTSFQKVCKKIQKISGKYTVHPPPLLEDTPGTLTQDPSITSNIFARAFSSVSSEENYAASFVRFKRQSESRPLNFTPNERHAYNEEFSMAEFNKALSLTNETSPGPDGITYSMIKNSHSSLRLSILQIFNSIYIEENFPSLWKLSVVIPIPKPEKDHSNPLNYRPISLTCCMCKLFEKMVNLRLMWFLEKENLINNNQSGFRRNRSTSDCIVQLECDLRNAISRREHTLAIFFDLTKAYDMSWKHGILMKLHEYGMRGHLPNLIKNFLTCRKMTVRVGNILSDTVGVDEGVPQGSVLSCTLFMIAINDATRDLPVGVRSSLYVDDLTIYMSGNSTNLIERQLQTAINRLERWSTKTGFNFSPGKSVAMHICRKRGCPKMAHQFMMKNTPILAKETTSYLGVMMDSSLTWTPHIKKLRSDCLRKLGLLKSISRQTWGADSKTLLRLYTLLIKPKLEYGSEAYSSACMSQMNKLEPIQNQAIRTAIGAFKSSPIASMQIISGIKPLHLSFDTKLLNFFLRILINRSNPINTRIQDSQAFNENDEYENIITDYELPKLSFLDRCRTAINKYSINIHNVFEENFSQDPPWKIGQIQTCTDMLHMYKNSTSDVVMRAKFLEHCETHSDSYNIYTDGSKTSDGVSYSVASRSFSIAHRIGSECSIFTAELSAILEAVTHAAATSHSSVTIITDSRSSIQAISKPFTTNPIINKIHAKLHSSEKSFFLCWVPSHVGVPGNEEADRLARAATTDPHIQPSPLTRDDIKSKVRGTARGMWREKWRVTTSNKLREVTEDLTPLPNSVCSNRHWERALARLRIGHSHMTHSYLMSGDEQPVCERCPTGAPLTIKHILTECPALRALRIRHLNRSRISMKSLLKDGDTSFGGAVYRFVQAADVLNSV